MNSHIIKLTEHLRHNFGDRSMVGHMVLVHGIGFDSLSPSMKIFSGRSNYSLANEICKYLDVSLGKLAINEFSDGGIVSCI